MPSPELTDFDRRFEDVVAQLRAAAPTAPDGLRDRVREIAASEPRTRRSFAVPRLRGRRAALVLVPACLLALVGAALVAGFLGSSGTSDRGAVGLQKMPAGTTTPAWDGVESGGGGAAGAVPAPPFAAGTQTQRALGAVTHGAAAKRSPVTLPPDRRRLQHYDVAMRLRVRDQDELSDATNTAMQLARTLGGFVAAVDYASSGRDRGDATLTLRVPVTQIQQAILRLSSLGTIVSQRIGIEDLQPALNSQNKLIFQLRKQIANLNAKLRDPSLSPGDRLEVQRQLSIAKARLDYLVGARGQTIRQGRLATVSVALTTRKAGAVAPHEGRIERSVRHAFAFLAKATAGVLYALIVVSPLLVLLALAYLARRELRRREEARLLAQA